MPSHQMQFTNFLIYSNHGVSDLHFPPVCELLFKDDAISRGVNTTSAINDRAARGARYKLISGVEKGANRVEIIALL